MDHRGTPIAWLKLSIIDSRTLEVVSVATDEAGRFSLEIAGSELAIYAADSESLGPLAHVRLDPFERRHVFLQISEGGVAVTEAPAFESGAASPGASSGAEEVADPSLEEIRNYQILDPGLAEANAQEMRALAEMVNPFAAQKSGRIHGSVYEFHRNDNFDARNFFDPIRTPLPEYKRNQFGMSVGLSLGRNLNILGSYEGLRIIQGSTLLSHLPTADMKRGDFSAFSGELRDPVSSQPFPGNRIPESRIHPVAKRLLHLLPDPNREDPDRNFVNNRPIVRNRDNHSYRLDYRLADGSSLVFGYYLSNGDHFQVHALPSLGSSRVERDQSASLTYTRRMNGRLLVSGRFDFGRDTDFLRSVNAGRAGLLESVGISGLQPVDPDEEGYPDMRLSGYASFGDAGLPVTSVNNRFFAEGSLSYTAENHSIRMGGNVHSTQANNHSSDGLRKGRFTFSGLYTGDAFADFLLGVPDSASRGVGSDRSDLRRRAWSVFLRDQWKSGPKLSISWGVTYSYSPPFRSRRDNISGFFPLLFEPPLEGEIVVAGTARARELGLDRAGRGSLVLPDRNDWAPSVGFAYRPFAGSRLVLRGSYGIGYSPPGPGYFVALLGRNFPFYFTESAQSPVDRAQLDLSHPFETAVRTELGVRGIETHLRNAYIQRWQLVLSSEVFRDWAFEASYDGSKGTHMPRILAANVPLPGPGAIQPRRPNPDFGRFTILTGGGAYNRHALEIALERRLSSLFALKSSFDWQVSVNDLFRGNPSNPRDLASERAFSDVFPRRHLFVNYIVHLPFGRHSYFGRDADSWMQALIGGWRLSGITRFQDGERYSVTMRGDTNNDGVAGDRPDRLGSGLLPSAERSIDRWFEASAFTAPDSFEFGDAGRNILVSPPYVNWDISLIKQARFSDGQQIELRVELFNAFNQVNFDTPNAVFGTSTFGKIFGAKRAREIEVALRYSF